MQVLVLAVQNAVPYEELGVATSSAPRSSGSIGGSLGTAVLGAIFTNRLTDLLAQRLPTGAGAPASGSIDPSAVHRLPAAIRDPYLGSFTDAVGSVFLVAAIVVGVAFVLAWFLPERPLRRTVEGGARLDDTFAPPRDADSMDELARRLRDTVGLDRTRRFLAATARAAGLDLSPAEAYLLGRAADGLSVDPAGVAAERDLDAGRLAAGLEGVRARGLLDGSDAVPALTDAGRTALARLVASRRACLEALLDQAPHEYTPGAEPMVSDLARELATEAPAR